MFDCIGDCRGTLQGGLQGDCRKTPRGLQEDVPVNPGGKGAAGTLGPASADLAQHARTSCRGTRRGLQEDCKEHCRGSAGKSWGDCKKMFLETLAARIPQEHVAQPANRGSRRAGGPAADSGDSWGTAGGTAGGLQGACRKIAGGLQGDVPGNSGGKGTAGTLGPTAVYSDCPPRGYPKNRNMKTDKKHP